MTDSMSLITAQISFLDPLLTLVHIPRQYYQFFLPTILRLLFGVDHDEDVAAIPWTNRHDFLNISITPTECSIICARDLADKYIRTPARDFNRLVGIEKPHGNAAVEISQDDYIVIQVDGQGLDAGQRVLELTSPLAMAGINIFFITTYFSDYILVPRKARRTVTKALEQRGFIFSHVADAYVSQLSPSSPTAPHHTGPHSSPKSLDSPPPSTPPAKDVPELQSRTFRKLKKNNIKPVADKTIRLVGCAGSREHNPAHDTQLKEDLLQVLLATTGAPTLARPVKPAVTPKGLGFDQSDTEDTETSTPDLAARFLSMTLTSTEPISLLFETSQIDHLGKTLLGANSDADVLIPITLDLRTLPMHATGIVCGVAGRLAQGTSGALGTDDSDDAAETLPAGSLDEDLQDLAISPKSSMAVPMTSSPRRRARNGENGVSSSRSSSPSPPASPRQQSSPSKALAAEANAIEISFLSTARAGTVIVKDDELEFAVRALREVVEVVIIDH